MTTCTSGEALAAVKLKDQLFIDAQCPEEIQKELTNLNSDCSSWNMSYVKYLQDAIKNLNGKLEALTREIQFIREENNALKNEVSILRKELENAISAGPLNFLQLKINGGDERRLSKFADAISLGKLTYQQQVYSELGPEEGGNKNLKSVLSSIRCRHLWYIFIMVLVLIGAAVALILLLPTQNEEEWDSEMSVNSSLLLYSREEWQAQPSRGKVKLLKENPPHYVIIAHTAGGNCASFNTCSQKVRDIQYDHMGRGWDDLGMHFLVGGDGAAYTGLGWGKFGSHTLPFNRRSIAIYFIGNFMFVLPPKRQIRAAKLLIEEGVRLGKIAPDYKLFAHKQVWATESPGAKLIEDMKKWPHWTTYEKSDE